MDHAVASVPRALRIREDVGRVTRDSILAAQAKLAASSTMTASKLTNSQSPAAKPVKRLRETISARTRGTSVTGEAGNGRGTCREGGAQDELMWGAAATCRKKSIVI